MGNVIAFDIGGTRFRAGLFDPEGHRLSILENPTNRQGGRNWMLEQLRACFLTLRDKSEGPVQSCGVSFGGPVNYDHQTVTSIHVPGWEEFALGKWLEEAFDVPCCLDNDANAGALGEHRFGAGRGCRTMIYITISTGIGGGIILDGKLHRGKDSLAGEIGHIPVSDSGVLCSCGARGCLETFCSGSAIALRGREWGRRRPEAVTRMTELSGGSVEDITAKALVQAAAEGNEAARQILIEASRWLARALMTAIRILNPERIVLGGGVAQAGSLLLNPVDEALEALGSPTIHYSTEVCLAELGSDSPLYGAAAMALELG
ncbi:MAG: ROK family protein [Terriglobia bacterium]